MRSLAISRNNQTERIMAKHLIDRVPFTPGDLTDHQHGTDDILTGANFGTNILIGDAGGGMFDHSKGGDDTFIGGVDPAGGPNNTMYGDAVANMSEHAQGGNDTFTGGGSDIFTGGHFFSNTAYVDAGGDMSDHSKGGYDTFTGRHFFSNTSYVVSAHHISYYPN